MQPPTLAQEVVSRQERERDYHRAYAAQLADQAAKPPLLDVLQTTDRRSWNSHWYLYDLLLRHDWHGKRVMIAGCGLGDDACRLAQLGAEVCAFDISPELVELARARAVRFGFPPIRFDVVGAEATGYEDRSFDAAIFHGVFHHISIGPALAELERVLKPGALLFAHEQYTHSLLERPRRTRFVEQVIYPRLRRIVYGTDTPYITADEAKLDEAQLDSILAHLTGLQIGWFCTLEGRFFPNHIPWASRLDRRMTALLGPLGRFIAGQVVFAGAWQHQETRA